MFINQSDLIALNPPFLGYGVCVSDINQDGAFEWVVANFSGPNRVLCWDTTRAALVDTFNPTLAALERQTIGLAAGDIDGDGWEELYALNTDTFAGNKRFGDNLFACRNNEWVDLFLLPENQSQQNRMAGRSVCATDRYGVGRYGFVVANYGGPFRLYEITETSALRDVAEEAGIALTTGGRSLLSLPLVSAPGRMDIFAANENGANFLFQNVGDGTYVDRADALGVADPFENGRGVAVLDADGDGRFDLAVGNWEGEHRLWMQSRAIGGFVEVAPPPFRRPSRIRTVIAADFDNDGYEEIFHNNIGEPNRLFAWRENEWRQVPIADAEEPTGLGTGAAVADLDDDGRLELLIAHGEAGAQPLSLYHTKANENHWLRVLPLTRHGAPARGAVVTLTTANPNRVQRRVIDAGSGYLCQMEPVAHFGLGAIDRVESMQVVWPGGASVTVAQPDVRQTLRVPFPDTDSAA